VLGAIVIAGQSGEQERSAGRSLSTAASSWENWHPCPASIPVLGCSSVARTVEYLRHSGIEEVSLFGGQSHTIPSATLLETERHAWRSAAEKLHDYCEGGLGTVLVMRPGAYAECDLAAFIGQHRDEGQLITRAVDRDGVLDIWAIDSSRFEGTDDLLATLTSSNIGHCEMSGYVNRLRTPEDFRRMVTDLLTGKCKMRPRGIEIRPGIWTDEGAQIGRGARIVAPAYVGREVRIAEDCLITRCSNVESWSHVDFGTAVEDSSVLTNTYVGIGLDLPHSIVDGDEILNLHHGVRLHISDPVVMRRNSPRGYQREQLSQPEASQVSL
jgi:hypothetical protein